MLNLLEMHIKAVTPLHILVPARGLDQVLVGDRPHERGNKYPDSDTVDEYHIEQKLEKGQGPDAEDEGKPDGGDEEPTRQQDQEGWIIPSKLQLCLLAVQHVPVHLKSKIYFKSFFTAAPQGYCSANSLI